MQQLALRDLVIRYDSVADRLVLRAASSGVEVVPVLTSGVSPSGIVSSLIHIGRQGMQAVGYLPGFHAPEIAYWPRITCGRVVLFRARWIFGRSELPLEAAPDAAFHLAIGRWREARGLPRHIFVHTSAEPKPFYLDLESPLLTDLLRRALAPLPPEGRLVVTEMLPGPGELWARDAAGAYATEFLLQMEGPDAVRSSVGAAAASAAEAESHEPAARVSSSS